MKSKFTALALAIVTLLAFSACKAKKSSFTFWHIGTAEADKAYYEELVAEFKQAHPGVEIEMTVLENEAHKAKIKTVMQSKNPPDLFYDWGGGNLAEWAAAGLLKDITKDVQGDPDLSSIAAGALGVYQANGKQYGVPHDMGAVTFWYNKELLSKVGYDSFPTDWNDFVTLIGKLKAAGITPIAVAGGDKWPAMYYFAYLALRLGGGELWATLDGMGSMPAGSKGFNDPLFVKAAEMVKELVDMGAFQNGFLGATYSDQATLVGNGQAAMELMGQWAPNVEMDSSTSKKGIGDKLGCAPFPAIKGGKGAVTEVMGGGNGISVGKDAPKEAIEFLKFVDNKTNNAKYATVAGIIPTVKGAESGMVDANAKLVKGIVDNCTFFQLYPDQFLSPACGGALNDTVQAIMAGTKSPADAMASLQAVYEE